MNAVPNRILIVDDDAGFVELLRFSLSRAGFDVLIARDREEALRLLANGPRLTILDVKLGTVAEYELLTEIMQRQPMPVVMLTARDTEDDVVRALELGASDYVTKPFSHRELVARVGANLRSWAAGAPAPGVQALEAGPVRLDPATHEVTVNGLPVSLTLTEFRLLQCLMVSAGSVVPSQTIIQRVWGYSDRGAVDVLRTTVHRLRRKLGDSGTNPSLIHTVPRVGFVLKP